MKYFAPVFTHGMESKEQSGRQVLSEAHHGFGMKKGRFS